ncbi:MAG: hypothetical protein RJB13_2585 [Pseudomonadota bacterium]|jgi:ABC-type multidrug transport system ATPase subunit
MTQNDSSPILSVSDLEFRIRHSGFFSRKKQKRLWSTGNITVTSPGIVLLIGHNGCGKTTLIRCLLGLMRPSRGHINWFGSPQMPPKNIGYLPELPVLPARTTVAEILGALLGLDPNSLPELESSALITAGLKIGDLLNRPAHGLSKGQQQRLLLTLSVLSKPKGFVLDEPFSGLDPWARTELAELMVNLAEAGHFILISSHDAPRHLRNHVRETWMIHNEQLTITPGCALPE